MPGLSQLKQFSNDILAIGDEVSIRASRGEKPVKIPIPKDITIENDSEDFVLGMPEIEAEEEVTPAEEDLSDLLGIASPQKNSNAEEPQTQAFEAPDLSSLLNPIAQDETSAGGEMPDLSMFMDEEEEEEVVEEEPEEEISIADMGLEALLAGGGFDEPEESPEEEETPEIDLDDTVDVDIDDLDEVEELDDKVPAEPEDPIAAIDPELAAILGDTGSSKEQEPEIDSSLFEPAEEPVAETSDFGINDFDTSLFEPEQTTEKDPYENIDIDSLSEPLEETEELAEEISDAAEDLAGLEDVGDLDSGFEDNTEASPAEELNDLNNEDFFKSSDFNFDSDDLEPVDLEAETTADDSLTEENAIPGNLFDASDLDSIPEAEESFGLDDLGEVTDFDTPEAPAAAEESFGLDDIGSADALDNLDFDTNGLDDIAEVPEAEEAFGDTTGLDDAGDLGDATGLDDLGDLGDLGEVTDFDTPEAPAAAEESFGLDDIGSADALDNLDFDTNGLDDIAEVPEAEDFGDTTGLDDAGDLGDATGLDDLGEIGDLGDLGDLGEVTDFDTPEAPAAEEESFGLDDIGSADALDNVDFDTTGLDDIPEVPAEEAFGDTTGLDDTGDFGDTTGLDDLGEIGDLGEVSDFDTPEAPAAAEESFGLDDIGSADALDNVDFDTNGLDDIAEVPAEEAFGDTTGLDDIGTNFDSSDFDLGNNDFAGDDDFAAVEEDDISEETPEVFDTTEMDGMDFDMPETDQQMGGDFDLGNSDDFAMEGDFEIPGFSDVDIIKEEKSGKTKLATGKSKKGKKQKDDVDVADFSQAVKSEELPPNTLSDEQYKTFLKNLSEYPLNVRLAIEDLLVKDEFTEDAEFEIVEKVLKKIPARQIAGTLEKMLDVSIPVPRDFEHRSAEEYEAYKKSLSYQLRNKIIPGAIAFVAMMIVAWGLFNFAKNCIYKPLMANHLYKQGYNLIVENEYPQSEMKFNEATKYRLSKKWFFDYARGYREHKQYQRAGSMYKNILYCFKHDKEAGLEYAAMELEDLANYERAEEIVKREVLDYHINDSDGILLLGDVYLEWGTEKDPSMLEMARQQYATLLQLYKANDLYLSRMMRYFIRSDKLINVLQLKDNFKKDKQLAPEDWTELSGYLLDKSYGTLAPADEYLRYQIEGLRGLLLRAARVDTDNPVAYYNLGRYYVKSNEMAGIEPTLQKAVRKFNDSEALKRRDIYKYIDSYKLLGEYYTQMTDYLQAQEQFAEGISLYATERDNAGFEGNAEIGKLFEDLGNIKYFVSGDYDEALLNFRSSVELNNDSPSIRYKIGYIQYQNKNFAEALGSFMKAGDGNIKEQNLMLAMANTLAIRGDDYTAQGYYERLINKLDAEIAEKGLVLPQKSIADNDLVTSYLYAANNYGVTLYNLAKRTGNSALNAQAIVQFQQSVRAWDSLTRNQNTLVRLGGSNLAEQNIQYITHRVPDYEPSIYINIPHTLSDRDHL